MKHLMSITVLATTIVVVACDSLTHVCTDQAVPAISLAVVDSITGANRLSGATVSARNGSFVDSQVFRDDTTRVQSGSSDALLAWERVGTYVVNVSRAGYRDWTASNVRVSGDACHPRTAHLLARLVPVD
jgi:hypothetical protein